LKFSTFYAVRESRYPLVFSWVLSFFFSSFFVFLKFGYYLMLFVSFFFLVFYLYIWRKDVYREALSGYHSFQIQGGFRVVFFYFLMRELMFFLAIFWYLFDVTLVPSSDLGELWVPLGVEAINPFGVPLLNSFILLSRAVSLTWAHYNFMVGKRMNLSMALTVILGLVFLMVQIIEYKTIGFSFRDGAYGSIFYMLTGFHGFHVFLGVFFLFHN
jgi:heme/copper-type cytochrome/quinol oxidase subunit 3